MKIEVIKAFLDGPNKFEAGDIRTVSDADGARFVAFGWAKDVADGVAVSSTTNNNVDLAIQSSTLGITSTIKE